MNRKEENVDDSYKKEVVSLSLEPISSITLGPQALETIHKVSISPVFENLDQLNQRLAESVYRVTTSPAFENAVKLNQQLADSIYKLSTSPVLENIARMNQQLAESVYRITSSPAFENAVKVNQQLADSMYKLSTSPVLENISIINQQLTESLSQFRIIFSDDMLMKITQQLKEIGPLDTRIEILSSTDVQALQWEATDYIEKIADIGVEEGDSSVWLKELLLDILDNQDVLKEDVSEIKGEQKRQNSLSSTLKGILLTHILTIFFLDPITNYFLHSTQSVPLESTTHDVTLLRKKLEEKQEQIDFLLEYTPSQYRIIKRANLEVKSNHKVNSKTISYLSVGDIVEVATKKRNWIKIRFYNHNGELTEGWVFTRYTKKLIK